MSKTKHFEKKIMQKTNAESPLENFSITYTEKSQMANKVKKDKNCIIFSEISMFKASANRQKAALPPSREASGNKLKMLNASDIKAKLETLGIFLINVLAKKKPTSPNAGPERAMRNSFL